MIYRQLPEGFKSRFEVVSCFLESDGEILLMLRQDHKPQGNTWGVPAGKVESGESPEDAIRREIKEETGYEADLPIKLFEMVYVRYPGYDFEYYIFHCLVSERPSVHIESEAHKEFRWVSPKDALSMPLIEDEDACIKLFYHDTLGL